MVHPMLFSLLLLSMQPVVSELPYADDIDLFSGLDSIQVLISVDEEIKQIISENEVRTKFELTLRNHGIHVSDNSTPYIVYVIAGVRDKEILAFSTTTSLRGPVIFHIQDREHIRIVDLWNFSRFGFFGVYRGNDILRESTVKSAEEIANLYLSANPRR